MSVGEYNTFEQSVDYTTVPKFNLSAFFCDVSETYVQYREKFTNNVLTSYTTVIYHEFRNYCKAEESFRYQKEKINEIYIFLKYFSNTFKSQKIEKYFLPRAENIMFMRFHFLN